MKKRFLLLAMSLSLYGIAQKVGINTTDPKAMLEVEYKPDLPTTMNQTIGLPRVTTAQRNNFENLQAGQMIWNTDKKCIEIYNGNDWICSYRISGETVVIDGKTIEGVGSDKCLRLVKDKNYNDPEHKFIYCEIEGPDGRRWLNNNLGAEYANIKSNMFNPKQQATSKTDKNAYGSLFQWQRSADGHELIDWETESGKHGVSTALSSSWTDAETNKFIIGKNTTKWSWVDIHRTNTDGNSRLWAVGGATNPCPIGFHVPSRDEWDQLFVIYDITPDSPFWDSDTKLRFTAAGWRHEAGGFENVSYYGYYWASTLSGEYRSDFVYIDYDAETMENNTQAYAQSIRCLKD